MSLRNIDELFEILNNDPSKLIGVPETAWLDFKSEPHLTPVKNGDGPRLSLARDVVAMANNGDGVLLIGVKTRQVNTGHEELADQLRPVPDDQFDPQQTRSVINEWVYPSVEIDILPHEVEDETGKLWTIHIRGKESSCPYLVSKEFSSEPSQAASRWTFSLYRRQGTDNMPLSPQEVHRWMQDGFPRLGDGRIRLQVPGAPADDSTTSAGVAPVTPTSPSLPISADAALATERSALEVQSSELIYFVQLVPASVGCLQRFFLGDGESLQEAMAAFSTIRASGFGLPQRASVERSSANTLRMGWGCKSGVSVEPSGLTTIICCQPILTWATETNAPAGDIYINPIAIPEFTLEACRFFMGEVLPRSSGTAKPDTHWRAGMQGLEDNVKLPTTLHGYLLDGNRTALLGHQPNAATDFTSDWEISKAREPEALAFSIAKVVYDRFAFRSDEIPFNKGDRISEAEIAALR